MFNNYGTIKDVTKLAKNSFFQLIYTISSHHNFSQVLMHHHVLVWYIFLGRKKNFNCIQPVKQYYF